MIFLSTFYILITAILGHILSSNNLSSIKLCSEHIIKKYFTPKDLILHLHLNSNVHDLYFNISSAIVYNNKECWEENILIYQKFYAYVIIFNENDAENVLDSLHDMDRWNSRSKFLIIYNGNLSKLFKLLSKYFVYNVVVLDVDALKIFTYNPYKYENFRQPDLNPVLLTTCINGELQSDVNLYPEKIPKTWRNSTIRISCMELSPYVITPSENTGLEIKLVDLMKDFMKYNVEYSDMQYLDWGQVNENGTYDGALGEVQQGTAAFGIGHFHLREIEKLFDFDFTFSYMDDDVCWGVPRALLKSHWDNLTDIFGPKMWTFTLLTLAVSFIFWHVMALRTPEELPYFKNILNSLEVQFVSILGLPLAYTPTSRPMKIFFMVISIFCFIVTTGWKSYLIYFLTHDSYGFQISNMQELIQSNLIFAIHPELILLHRAEGTPEGDYIFKHADPDAWDDTHEYDCLDQTAYIRDMATISTKRIFNYLIPQRYKTNSGNDMIYVFKKCLAKDYTVQYYTKGHPTFPRINEFLIWIRTSGFMENLDNRLNHKVALDFQQHMAKLSLFETKVLGMKQMQGSFIILLVGLLISFVIFLIEIAYYRSVKRAFVKKIRK